MRGGILLGRGGGKDPEPIEAPKPPPLTPDQVRAMDFVEQLRKHLLDQLEGLGIEREVEMTPVLFKAVGMGYAREACAHFGVLRVLDLHTPYLGQPARGCARCHSLERARSGISGNPSYEQWPCPTLESALVPYRVLVETWPGAIG